MKRLLLILVAVIFLFGCSSETENTQPKADGKSKVTQVVMETLVMDEIGHALDGKKTMLPREELLGAIGISFDIDAKALSREYNSNEVAADAKYKGKNILVRGVVEAIAKDAFDNPYLSIKGSQMFHTVHAQFPDSALDDLAKMKKGQNVALICKVSGMIIGSVMAEGCSQIDSYTNGNHVKKAVNSYAKDILAGESGNCHIAVLASVFAKNVPQGSSCHEVAGDSCLEDIRKIVENLSMTDEEKEQMRKCDEKE